MKRVLIAISCAALLVPFGTAQAKTQPKKSTATCAGVLAKNHRTLGAPKTQTNGSCTIQTKNGFPMPDPTCTPGAFNPTVTLDVLKSPGFRTGCVRDKIESEAKKHEAYGWYSLTAPANNTGETMTCELDHLVPLEIGGADSMDNIWPQCGPDKVTLKERYFKQKDKVELYLAGQVKAGAMDLATAQRAIAKDYTQFLDAAKTYCAAHSCKSN